MANEIMDIILDIPHVLVREIKQPYLTKMVFKSRRKFNDEDRKKINKDYKAIKLLVCSIDLDAYNRI